jgi:hypothetical protein
MEKLLSTILAATSPIPVWWEPGTAGVLDIGDVSVFLASLVAFTTVFMMVSRWWMKGLRKVINEEITVATAPIHPSANGGLSLADVARKTDLLETAVLKIQVQNDETKELLAKVLAQAIIIPDLAPSSTPRKKSNATPRTRKKDS